AQVCGRARPGWSRSCPGLAFSAPDIRRSSRWRCTIEQMFERIRTRFARRREGPKADEGDHPLTVDERHDLDYRPIDDLRVFGGLYEPPPQLDPKQDRF